MRLANEAKSGGDVGCWMRGRIVASSLEARRCTVDEREQRWLRFTIACGIWLGGTPLSVREMVGVGARASRAAKLMGEGRPLREADVTIVSLLDSEPELEQDREG